MLSCTFPLAATLATPSMPSSFSMSCESRRSVSSTLSIPSISMAATVTGIMLGFIFIMYGVPTISPQPPETLLIFSRMSAVSVSMLASSVSCSITCEAFSLDTEVISSTWSNVAIACSMGFVTSSSTSSGAAPG